MPTHPITSEMQENLEVSNTGLVLGTCGTVFKVSLDDHGRTQIYNLATNQTVSSMEPQTIEGTCSQLTLNMFFNVCGSPQASAFGIYCDKFGRLWKYLHSDGDDVMLRCLTTDDMYIVPYKSFLDMEHVDVCCEPEIQPIPRVVDEHKDKHIYNQSISGLFGTSIGNVLKFIAFEHNRVRMFDMLLCKEVVLTTSAFNALTPLEITTIYPALVE